jgi:hypothetical protein
VFTPDGSRIAVTFQGFEEVRVYEDLPGYDLNLSSPTSTTLGSSVPVQVGNVQSGKLVVLFASLGAGPQFVGPHTVFLSDPFFILNSSVGNLSGQATMNVAVPLDPLYSGITVFLQAGTTDRSGQVRLSGGTFVSIL